MAAPDQDALRRLWLGGRSGSLSALSQARVWALREAWQETHDSTYGMLAFICGKVQKVDGSPVSQSGVYQLLERIDADDAWFPGKIYRERSGPKPALSGSNAALVAKSAMRIKEGGGEPTYGLVLAACPRAALNPATSRPVGKKRVYDVMRAQCHDPETEGRWTCRPRLSKVALTPQMRAKRHAYAAYVQGLALAAGWFFRNVVWIDICNSVLPLSQQKATQQAQARKGRKGWMSEGSQTYSQNLRGPKEAVKQNSWDATRVWFFPMLAMGKFHLEMLPEDFPGETPEGAAMLVAKVAAALSSRFPNAGKPRVLFSDRGRGFYAPRSGRVTPEYQKALRQHGLRAFMGDDAGQQPGTLAQVLLHETAMSWTRHVLQQTLPPRPWEETKAEYGSRLRHVGRHINAEYDVDALCRAFPSRIAKLLAAEGDNLQE